MHQGQYNEGFNSFMSKYRARWIQEYFGRKKIRTILDVGCGTGDIIKRLLRTSSIIQCVRRISMIDTDLTYLRIARRRFSQYRQFEFVRGEIESLATRGPYDLIIMIDLLEHLPSPLAVMKKIHSLLSARGYGLLVVPNARSLHRRIGLHMGLIRNLHELGEADRRVGHKRYYDADMLQTLVRRAGYRLRHAGGILLKPLPNNKMETLAETYCDSLYELGKELPDYCAEAVVVFSKQ